MNDSTTYAHQAHTRADGAGRSNADSTEEQRVAHRHVPASGLVHADTHGRLARAAAGVDVLGGTQVAGHIADALRRRRGRGTPLPDHVAGPMSQALGADLSAVRVHTDDEADALSRAIQARAFTSGTDVYFTTGTYDPSSTTGRHLLAHELAHVAQATRPGATHGGPLTIGRADDPAETEADHMADHALGTVGALSGGLRRTLATTPASGGAAEPALVIHRDWADDRAAHIGAGHAFTQHASEYNPVPTQAQFITLVANAMRGATANKALSNSRHAYWLSPTVVIYDPNNADWGTAFKPTAGVTYYTNLT